MKTIINALLEIFSAHNFGACTNVSCISSVIPQGTSRVGALPGKKLAHRAIGVGSWFPLSRQIVSQKHILESLNLILSVDTTGFPLNTS